MFSLPWSGVALAQAQTPAEVIEMQGLLAELKEAPDPQTATQVLRRIQLEWSKSGSAAMDLLLKRGRDAMEDGELTEAIEHFTALTDHAPEFAEGWHSRAMAFYRQERFGLAVADLERTLELNPDHFGAIRGIGAIYENLGRPLLAWRAYKLAETYYPFDSEIADALKRLQGRAVGVDL
ncbi:tetratricopeptide repeat protein [Pseudaestuariivita sp.]|uniref:tetratricopeptide repeat protein n=1 Tax=Pseudaestuariivita sp. TaxID=2211669 RepID=UPI0040580D7A